MAIQQQFFLKEDESGVGVDTNIVEMGSKDGMLLRIFPVDNYSFPEEIKRHAKKWHVIKVPLLGQKDGKDLVCITDAILGSAKGKEDKKDDLPRMTPKKRA
ncbi:hypothetical protein F0U60_02520 [Archangium minus]|uniref:Uncharacterized protein n=1 Tax=Archangium minus TaxID=83450 RepID=A0ABY9WII1_9BACT|nr:hypothetical protein F0U60_02520 [Archangium minus]